MKTRLLAVATAVLLGIVGTVVLVGYVRGADARALAGTDTVKVLVAIGPIPAGTPGEALTDVVETKVIPAVAAVPGRVADLNELTGQLSLVALVAGEQLLPSQFTAPDASATGTAASIPNGLQQVTVMLQSQRALGGQLKVGDHVGVFLSFAPDVMVYSTHLRLSKVLVTSVRATDSGANAADAEATAISESASTAAPAAADPGPDVYVTFAVSAADAEQLVFGAEHGTIWLSNEPLDADETGTHVVQPTSVYGTLSSGAP